MAWIILSAAVVVNVFANFMFKMAMVSSPNEISFSSLLAFALNPYLWLGGMSAVAMLGLYLLALKFGGLSATYAFATSMSLVGITIVSAVFYKEAMTVQHIGGVVLVLAGIILISTSAHNTAAEAVEVAAVAEPAK